jgi:hypothetical protein
VSCGVPGVLPAVEIAVADLGSDGKDGIHFAVEIVAELDQIRGEREDNLASGEHLII